MATLYQVKSINKLTKEGWKVLGSTNPNPKVIGSSIVMQNLEGKKFIVGSDGIPVLAPEDIKWYKHE